MKNKLILDESYAVDINDILNNLDVKDTSAEEPISRQEASDINFTETVNRMIQECWGKVSDYNSTIASLRVEDETRYQDIISILENIVKEELVNIGQLQVILDKLNITDTSLIDDGQDKAEEITSID